MKRHCKNFVKRSGLNNKVSCRAHRLASLQGPYLFEEAKVVASKTFLPTNANYRPEKVNSFLELTHSSTLALKQNKNALSAFAKASEDAVAPVGIEPTSSESESEILSIEIRSQKKLGKDRNSQ